ncbi:unnamed protein product [Somion occarium]|uniref:Uncharacterized protein n=1 Tax=Somion occarium TaxID=3059160 RepID=A0ABP1CH43_9APHY
MRLPGININMQITPLDVDLRTYGFPQGYFLIKNVASNRFLDVDSDMVEDGTGLILYPQTETSLVEDMRKPESNNQVFFIDTSGALCSRSSGHSIDVENETLVLRHRRPISHPFPNAYSHPLPRFVYEPTTGRITIVFAADPSYPTSPDRAAALSSWKDKTYVLSSIPMRKPRTFIDDASQLITSAINMPFSLLNGRTAANATPDAVFSSGDIDLKEDEILEQERSEEGEVDDSPEKIRRVRVVGLTKADIAVMGDQAKARQRWEVIPLRSTRNRTWL